MIFPATLAVIAWMVSPHNELQKRTELRSSIVPTPIVHPSVDKNLYMIQTIAREPNSVVWIDFENVRGKAGFHMSHLDLIKRISTWSNVHKLEGKVCLVIDHGAKKCGYYLDDKTSGVNTKLSTPSFASGLSIVFAGPNQTADDAIVHDIGLFHGGSTVVITADALLRKRCGRQVQSTFHTIQPQAFLDELDVLSVQLQKNDQLESTLLESSILDEREGHHKDNSSLEKPYNGASNGESGRTRSHRNFDQTPERSQEEDQELFEELEVEINLKGKILETKRHLRKKRITNKRRKSLEYRLHNFEEKLASFGPSKISKITTHQDETYRIESNDHDCKSIEANEKKMIQRKILNNSTISTNRMSRGQQDFILSRWQETRSRQFRREGMGDRQVLAERLRRFIMQASTLCAMDDTSGCLVEFDETKPVKAHVSLVNGLVSRSWLQRQQMRVIDRRTKNSTVATCNDAVDLIGEVTDYSIDQTPQAHPVETEPKSKQLEESNQESTMKSTTGDKSGNEARAGVSEELFLAVGGGLDSGIALFSNHGRLIRYDQFYFQTVDEIDKLAEPLIKEWVAEAQGRGKTRSSSHQTKDWLDSRPQNGCDDLFSSSLKLSYLAIGKNGRDHRNAWARVAASSLALIQPCHLLSVSMAEWRMNILSPKEFSSGARAQREAIGLIARQIIADFGAADLDLHQGKLKPSVAEAIVLGFYISTKLGWIVDPVIKRYSNGKVVITDDRKSS